MHSSVMPKSISGVNVVGPSDVQNSDEIHEAIVRKWADTTSGRRETVKFGEKQSVNKSGPMDRRGSLQINSATRDGGDYPLNYALKLELEKIDLSDSVQSSILHQSDATKRKVMELLQAKQFPQKTKQSTKKLLHKLENAKTRSRRREVLSKLNVSLRVDTAEWITSYGVKCIKIIMKAMARCKKHLERSNLIECIRCIRSIMHSKCGLQLVCEHSDLIVSLVFNIDENDRQLTSEILQVLTIMVVVSEDALTCLLGAMESRAKMRAEHKFDVILNNMLCLNDIRLVTVCLQLTNALVNTPEQLHTRVRLRDEFIRRGLDKILETLQVSEPEEACASQIKIFLHQAEEDAQNYNLDDPVVLRSFCLLQNAAASIPVLPIDTSDCGSDCLEKDSLKSKCNDSASTLRSLSSENDVEKLREELQESRRQVNEIHSKLTAAHAAIQAQDAENTKLKDKLDETLELLKTFTVALPGNQPATISTELLDDNFQKKNTESKHESELISQLPVDYKSSTVLKSFNSSPQIAEIAALTPEKILPILPTSVLSLTPPSPPPPPPPPPPPSSMPPAPPPPPPPPPSLVAQQSGLSKQIQPPLPVGMKSKHTWTPPAMLKPLNWKQISPYALKDTFWFNLDESLQADERLLKTLDEQFQKAVAKTASIAGTTANSAQKSLKVLDDRAAQNLGILIRTLKLSADQIIQCVKNFDVSKMKVSQIDGLLASIPDDSTLKELQLFTNKTNELLEQEVFLLQLSSHSNLVCDLKALRFKISYAENLLVVRDNVKILIAALTQIRDSTAFRRILQIVLLCGNYMNSQTRNAGTHAFDISFLPSIANTKAKCGKLTLLHVLVKLYPEILDIQNELSHLNEASRLSEEEIKAKLIACKLEAEEVEKAAIRTKNKHMMQIVTCAQQEILDAEMVMGDIHKVFGQLYKTFAFSSNYTITQMLFDLKQFKDQLFDAGKQVQIANELSQRQADKVSAASRSKSKAFFAAATDSDDIMKSIVHDIQNGKALRPRNQRSSFAPAVI